MKLNQKSQVTMLMIIGLVLFIVVSLVLYLSKVSIKKQSQQSIKITQTTAIEPQPIKEFVQKCLDKLAKDAVILLGKQGGYIYKSQGGTLIDYLDTDEGVFFVKYNNHNVVYNIFPPKLVVSSYSSEIPDYPWIIFPYTTLSSNEEVFEGFFGISNTPPLDSSGGPNSIQTQIEAFIDKNLVSCADFNIFQKQGIDVVMGSIKTSVVIGANDVSIKSKIPITITDTITNEFVEISDFSTNINVRLRNTYFFIKELIENDIKNIRFNITDTKNNKDSFNIKLIKDVLSNDDLIIITDGKSLIYAKPFEYIFARRNRAPALYYIKNTTLEFPHNYQISQEDLLQGSELKAEDPDEDSYTFTITPPVPKVLNVPQINFKVEVSDGKLSDYQVITVNRI